MKPDDLYTALPRPESAVLLVFLGPVDLPARQQRTSVAELTASLQAHFGTRLRVLRIDALTHPDVARSFAITQTPTFVLVRQGVELWRQTGMTDKDTLVVSIQRLILS